MLVQNRFVRVRLRIANLASSVVTVHAVLVADVDLIPKHKITQPSLLVSLRRFVSWIGFGRNFRTHKVVDKVGRNRIDINGDEGVRVGATALLEL